MNSSSSYENLKRTRGNEGWGRAAAFISVFCILASLALVREGKLFGMSFDKETEATEKIEAVAPDGASRIINTSALARDVSGYGGPVPVEIFITGGRIDSVRPLPNSETPHFFSRLEEEGLFKSWDGLPVAEAASLQVDAVSGATYSSTAVITNVRRGLEHDLRANGPDASGASSPLSLKQIAVLVVLLMAAVIPLFVKNKKYRFVQQLLNVGVLGFWGGTFIDYAMMVRFFSSAPSFSLAAVITLLLLITGFIYPLFGRPGFYCANVCPLGSLQELASLCSPRKLRLSPRAVRILDIFKESLWTILLLLLLTGWWTEWIDNELFTAFIVQSAATAVIICGISFIILSAFIRRPFCRFVCPTGTLLHKSQNINTD